MYTETQQNAGQNVQFLRKPCIEFLSLHWGILLVKKALHGSGEMAYHRFKALLPQTEC